MPRAWMRRLVAGLVVTAASLAHVAAQSSAWDGARRVAAGPNTPTSCPHPTIPVPRNEPVYTTGPTELVSGLYIQGGAIPPPCKPQPRGPYAGTVRVTNPRTGVLVARQTVRDGHLAHIRLAAGRYSVTGHFSGGYTTMAVKVRVEAGKKVRQDLFEDVP